MFRIYTKGKKSREVHSINLTADEVNLILKGNYFKDCPEWNEDNAVVVEKEYFYPTWTGTELREMTQEELKLEGTIALDDGEYIQEGKIIKVEVPKEMLKPKWNKEKHIWEETASDTEINLKAVREQYNEFEPMNNPLTFIELEEQGLKQEYVTMMRELQSLIVQLETQMEKIRESEDRSLFSEVTIDIPQPSEALIKFKNKFNLI